MLRVALEEALLEGTVTSVAIARIITTRLVAAAPNSMVVSLITRTALHCHRQVLWAKEAMGAMMGARMEGAGVVDITEEVEATVQEAEEDPLMLQLLPYLITMAIVLAVGLPPSATQLLLPPAKRWAVLSNTLVAHGHIPSHQAQRCCMWSCTERVVDVQSRPWWGVVG